MTGEDKGSVVDEDEEENSAASRSSRRSKSQSQLSRVKSEVSGGAAEKTINAVIQEIKKDAVAPIRKASSRHIS